MQILYKFGTQRFNALPKHPRDLYGVGVDVSKKLLDFWLPKIPDEPISRQEDNGVEPPPFTKSQPHRID